MTLIGLYFLFVKYGLLSFGGGYVLVPLLLNDFVTSRGIMTAPEFAKLVAVAQMTPGPLGINTATYVGYKLFGVTGALAGTAGLVTPALLLVILAVLFIKRYEKTLWMSGALCGLRSAAYGLILVAVFVFAELAIFTVQMPENYLREFMTANVPEWDFSWRPLPLLLGVLTLWFQVKKSGVSFLWLLFFSALLGAFFCR